MASGAMPTGPMTMGPQAGPGPRGPMGSGSLGVGAMNNSLLPGGMGVSMARLNIVRGSKGDNPPDGFLRVFVFRATIC